MPHPLKPDAPSKGASDLTTEAASARNCDEQKKINENDLPILLLWHAKCYDYHHIPNK